MEPDASATLEEAPLSARFIRKYLHSTTTPKQKSLKDSNGKRNTVQIIKSPRHSQSPTTQPSTPRSQIKVISSKKIDLETTPEEKQKKIEERIKAFKQKGKRHSCSETELIQIEKEFRNFPESTDKYKTLGPCSSPGRGKIDTKNVKVEKIKDKKEKKSSKKKRKEQKVKMLLCCQHLYLQDHVQTHYLASTPQHQLPIQNNQIPHRIYTVDLLLIICISILSSQLCQRYPILLQLYNR
eukprot:TRINITY_DN5279_c0_g1_i1.p1 TRINITY_DN5279_c0_g1~~TRINITY_DN5279_c0_g1_i1.p1  ORF type:complete len:239 (+),score=23.00 TRINITY_DN5279_c0_g1_i1:32-748(+)